MRRWQVVVFAGVLALIPAMFIGVFVWAGRDAGPVVLPSPGDIAANPFQGDVTPVTVVRVVDGDTVHVAMPDGSDETVRLLGINAPETTKGKDECYGQQATDWLRTAVVGLPVTLTRDPSQDDRDRWRRLLRYINDTTAGDDIDLELIRQGFAHEATYDGAYGRQGLYRQAQREAQAERRGGWADCGW